ncbi:pleiotropic drug resistance ABC transporter [Salix suchowensis]|nr:pleiotropic drug resistance ABC transporter [Salix suchowensis]
MASTPADAATLYEEKREAPPGLSGREEENIPQNEIDAHHVDVASAERTFNELSRTMSIRTQVERSGVIKTKSQETMWWARRRESYRGSRGTLDLREYLTSSNDANQSAGIKHKVGFHRFSNVSFTEIFTISTSESRGTTWSKGHWRCYPWFRSFADILGMELIAPIVPFCASPDTCDCAEVRISSRTQLGIELIIIRSSGVLKPGEMCLVLGCPGSGCTSFLKAIANQRDEFFSVTGDVRYAAWTPPRWLSITRVKSSTTKKVIDPSPCQLKLADNFLDDIHIATLTVAQTLQLLCQ